VDDKGDSSPHTERLEERVEVAAVLDEGVGMGTAVRQLVRIAHANQVGREAMAEAREVGDDVASEGGGCRVAVEEDDRVALPGLDIGHGAPLDLSILLVRHG
jgi:hypothetical protein